MLTIGLDKGDEICSRPGPDKVVNFFFVDKNKGGKTLDTETTGKHLVTVAVQTGYDGSFREMLGDLVVAWGKFLALL